MGSVAIRMVPDRRQNDLGRADFAPGGEEALRPYRRLAIRVLERALLDVTNAAGSAKDRESARVFLASSRMLGLWCRVAALDPSYVVGRVQGSRPPERESMTQVDNHPARSPRQSEGRGRVHGVAARRYQLPKLNDTAGRGM
jgi:hypothetical protein